MKLDLKFKENAQSLELGFGQFQDLTDGGYERGYAAGYEDGNIEGYAKGHTEGVQQGYAEGYATGAIAVDTILSNGEMDIYSTVTNVRQFACYGFTGLKTVNLPNATKLDNQAFRACTNLITINAPKVKSLGSYCFYTCGNLSVVDFPVLTAIPVQCFAISPKLNTVILRSETTVTLNNVNAFERTPIASGTGYIYVPDNLVEQYKVATNWSTYASQIKPLSELGEQNVS